MKILIAEDERDMNLLITKTLKKSGYSADSCFDGREALDFLLAAEHDGDSLTGMELLGNAAAAPGILGALGFSRGHFRTPGTALPGAMFRPLRAGADAPGYFGLIFD